MGALLLKLLSSFILVGALLEKSPGQLGVKDGKLVTTGNGTGCCCAPNVCSCCLPGHRLKSMTVQITVPKTAEIICEPLCTDFNASFLLVFTAGSAITTDNCCCVYFEATPWSDCDNAPAPYSVGLSIYGYIGCEIFDVDSMTRFIAVEISGPGASGSIAKFKKSWPPSTEIPFDCENLDWTGILDFDSVAGDPTGPFVDCIDFDEAPADGVVVEVIDVEWY